MKKRERNVQSPYHDSKCYEKTPTNSTKLDFLRTTTSSNIVQKVSIVIHLLTAYGSEMYLRFFNDFIIY